MPDELAKLLANYGYFLVFFGVFLENAGLPLPGETALLGAAFLAQRGMFELPVVVLVAIVAAILGDNCGFWIGRRGGRALAEKHGAKIGLTAVRLVKLEAFFAKHGAKTVFFARFIAGLRVFGALLAGMSDMPWRRFLMWNATGAVAWSALCGAVGYTFGKSWELLEAWIGRAAVIVLAVGVLFVTVILLRRHGRRLARALRAEMLRPLTRRELIYGCIAVGGTVLMWIDAYGVRGDVWHDVDRAFLMGLHQTLPEGLRGLMRAFTEIGSGPILLPAMAIMLVWSWLSHDRRAAVVLAVALVVNEATGAIIKTSFQRARPDLWSGYLKPASYSFPSGHSMSSVACWGLVFALLLRRAPRCRVPVIIVAPLLAIAIGTSRMFLGVHWPSDVMGGWLCGLVIWAGGMVVLSRPQPTVIPPAAAA